MGTSNKNKLTWLFVLKCIKCANLKRFQNSEIRKMRKISTTLQ